VFCAALVGAALFLQAACSCLVLLVFWKAPSRSLAPAKVGVCQSGAEAAFRRPW
jgi:hypothetical protein